jgi:hypothetical protein
LFVRSEVVLDADVVTGGFEVVGHVVAALAGHVGVDRGALGQRVFFEEGLVGLVF